LWVVDAAPGSTPKNLTAAYDFDVNSGIGGDQSAPRGQNPTPIVWSNDASSLIVVAAEKGSANLKRVTIATGKIEPITDARHAVMAYSATADASTFAATISTQTNIGDIALVDVAGGSRRLQASGSLRQVTRVNDELFKDIRQSDPEEIWYRTFDGKQIQGWI